MAADENLQRAQLELKQRSTRASQKQQSPVKKIFKDDDRDASKLARTKSGNMRTPLNLDVAQAFQSTGCSKPSQVTDTHPA